MFVPIKIELLFRNSGIILFLSFIFFRFRIRNKNRIINNEKTEYKKNIRNFFSQIDQILDKLKFTVPFFIFIIKKIRICKMILHMRISSDDAKKCATDYSNIYSFFVIIFHILKSKKKKIKKLNFNISPDFISYGTSFLGEFCISISIVEIIYFSVCYFISYFENKIRE